jgi:hypothetical protein
MYRSILVPLDGSLSSEQSLPYAAALAQRSGASHAACDAIRACTNFTLGP